MKTKQQKQQACPWTKRKHCFIGAHSRISGNNPEWQLDNWEMVCRTEK